MGARDISAHGKKLQRKIEVIKQMYFSLTQDYHDARIMQLDREIYDFYSSSLRMRTRIALSSIAPYALQLRVL